MPQKGSFGKGFEYKPATEYLRKKTAIPTSSYRDISRDMHAHAFMVAGAANIDIVSDFQDAVTKAIEDGQSLEQFRNSFDDIVARYGWSYNGKRGWRSQLIYRVNMRSAYAAGQWQQYQETKDDFPYLKYVTAGDDKVRDEHAHLNGAIYPIDDPFWQSNYPPNGYNCRCTTVPVSEEDAKGKVRRTPKGKQPEKLGENQGFDYNVGIASSSAASAVAVGTKIMSLPAPARSEVLNRAIKQAPSVLTPAFQSMIKPRLEEIGKGVKVLNTGKTVPVGFLPDAVIDYLESKSTAPSTAIILAQDKKLIYCPRFQSAF